MTLSLQEISDRMEIQDLLYRYAEVIDGKRFDELYDVFSEDAHIDYSVFGGSVGNRDHTIAFLKKAMPMFPNTQHSNANAQIEVGHPGFYGRIEIGGFPEPRLIFPEPVIIDRVRVVEPPIYLHVPPGHAKDWGKHCAKYDACGHRVFFVQDGWYDEVYVPAYQKRHGGGGKNHGEGHGKGHGHKGH